MHSDELSILVNDYPIMECIDCVNAGSLFVLQLSLVLSGEAYSED